MAGPYTAIYTVRLREDRPEGPQWMSYGGWADWQEPINPDEMITGSVDQFLRDFPDWDRSRTKVENFTWTDADPITDPELIKKLEELDQ